MRLSKDSTYLPTIQECLKCPYVNKCGDGEKCKIDNYKYRDRRAEYQAKKLKKQLGVAQ